MSTRENLLKTTSIRKFSETFDGIGEILFIEPSKAECKLIQNKYMPMSDNNFVVDPKNPKDQKMEIKLDSKLIDIEGYNKALVMATAWEPDESEKIFRNNEDFESIFGGNPPKHGAQIFDRMLRCAEKVIQGDEEEIKKN